MQLQRKLICGQLCLALFAESLGQRFLAATLSTQPALDDNCALTVRLNLCAVVQPMYTLQCVSYFLSLAVPFNSLWQKNISGSSSFSMSPHHNPTAITSIQASWSGMARLLIRWEWACRGQLMTSNCVVLTGPAARRPTPCNEDGDGHIPVSCRWPHAWKRVNYGGDLLGALRAQTNDYRAG